MTTEPDAGAWLLNYSRSSVSSGFLTAWEIVGRVSDHGTYSFPMCSAVRIFFFFSLRLRGSAREYSVSRRAAETQR
ncbi:MAG: hypothetical protein B6245_10190 [Desulfobacteraceae bacterium 4572_88]|nr:MAG: hypothetical protein B6245_10190 [Desulfobacteraceae bacterium 4572_88]